MLGGLLRDAAAAVVRTRFDQTRRADSLLPLSCPCTPYLPVPQIFEFLDKGGKGRIDLAAIAAAPEECLGELDEDVSGGGAVGGRGVGV